MHIHFIAPSEEILCAVALFAVNGHSFDLLFCLVQSVKNFVVGRNLRTQFSLNK